MAPTCVPSSPQQNTTTPMRNSPANTGKATAQVSPAALSAADSDCEPLKSRKMIGRPAPQASAASPSAKPKQEKSLTVPNVSSPPPNSSRVRSFESTQISAARTKVFIDVHQSTAQLLAWDPSQNRRAQPTRREAQAGTVTHIFPSPPRDAG